MESILIEILIEKIRQLPPEFHEEVLNFIDFLHKNKSKRKKQPKFEWIGGLKPYREQYTSLELQKKATDWRD